MANSPLKALVALAFLTPLGVTLPPGRLTVLVNKERFECTQRSKRTTTTLGWSAWGSPVGLGMFFVLIAVAIDLVRLAFK
jgi:hypothetical protein